MPNMSILAAANSIAKGIPSSSWQMRQALAASASVKSNLFIVAAARSTKSWTASNLRASVALMCVQKGGVSNADSRRSRSPFTRNGSRLVASMLIFTSFFQKARYKIGRSSDDMLAVVEYKQHLPVSQRGDHAGERIVATNCQPQGGRQCCKYKVRS